MRESRGNIKRGGQERRKGREGREGREGCRALMPTRREVYKAKRGLQT